ncbi:MAG TPA: hypothetical protein VK041_07660 [Opitutales bacterium]|nr:hypothetical protein [Opitutales bacterium]
MSPTIIIILLCALLIGLAWISISVATEDGFFASLCTLIVLFIAYQFIRYEWGYFFQFLSGSGMSKLQTVSISYWIGFLMIVGPGVLITRLLAKPKVPFPVGLEKYGTIAIGALAGILIFATLIHWVTHIDFLLQAMYQPLQFFKPLFDVLGYRAERFS